jgi:hypothetical protein
MLEKEGEEKDFSTTGKDQKISSHTTFTKKEAIILKLGDVLITTKDKPLST